MADHHRAERGERREERERREREAAMQGDGGQAGAEHGGRGEKKAEAVGGGEVPEAPKGCEKQYFALEVRRTHI